MLAAPAPIAHEELHRLLSAVSHDLREPLRAVRGFSDLLEQEAGDRLGERGERFLELIQAGAARMEDLLDGLSRYNRAGSAPLAPADVDAQAALAEALRRLEPVVTVRGGRVTSDPLPAVHADPAALAQVLEELVANALAFAGPDPCVHVGARAVAAGVELTVADDGDGIAEGDREGAFELFRRLHARAAHAGAGAGLAVCRRLVERQGGTVVAGAAPGGGAELRVVLPAAGAGPA